MKRRAWLAATAALAIPGPRGVLAKDPPAARMQDQDPKVLAELRSIFADAGSNLERGARTKNFLIFDADARDAGFGIGRFCEDLLAEAKLVFARTSLAMREPDRRLSVVIMRPDRYARISRALNGPAGAGGFYSNRFGTSFLRFERSDEAFEEGVDYDGTLETLGHECMHQICYSVGLLRADADCPACICEGLATLGEVRSWTYPRLLRQTRLTHLNRLTALDARQFIPLADFFENDALLYGATLTDEGSLNAYAWAWLLAYVLMTERTMLPKFAAYLRTIGARKDMAKRVDDARDHLGDLRALQKLMLRKLHRLEVMPPSQYASFRRTPKAT